MNINKKIQIQTNFDSFLSNPTKENVNYGNGSFLITSNGGTYKQTKNEQKM